MSKPHNTHTMRHGVFINVFGKGVLLLGKSGIGKSELALALINRQHALIADDSVIFAKTASNTIVGSCPELLQDFLEVRGLGILNIRALFGDEAITHSRTLSLIITLLSLQGDEYHNIDRIHGLNKIQNILDVPIPEVRIPVATGGNLSILVESAVRNQTLKDRGYDAGNEFIVRHSHLINRETYDC